VSTTKFTRDVKQAGGNLDATACGNKSVLLKNNVDFAEYSKLERRLVESWAIQALGTTRRKPCTPCSEGKGIFKDCRTATGLLEGVCGNCKRRERCGECNFSEVWKEGNRESLRIQRAARKAEKEEVTGRDDVAGGRYEMRTVTRPTVYGR
jgi:hypothetical protein